MLVRWRFAPAHARALERGLLHVELDVRAHNRSARAFVQERLRLDL
jgi:hypothetical protein